MYHPTTQRILNILDKINCSTIKERLDLIKSCVIAGEWDMAIEDICSNIYEFDVIITKDAYNDLQAIAKEIDMDDKYLKLIENNISD